MGGEFFKSFRIWEIITVDRQANMVIVKRDSNVMTLAIPSRSGG
jgi:hypothetical protein